LEERPRQTEGDGFRYEKIMSMISDGRVRRLALAMPLVAALVGALVAALVAAWNDPMGEFNL
jgi:hypothetical protein